MSDSKTLIEDLPSEILCYILSRLDGRSLACAALVCQRWNAIITTLGKGFNIWYRCCIKEYGLDALVAQTGLTSLLTAEGRGIAETGREKWLFWKEVYAVKQRSDCVSGGLWAMKKEKANMWQGVVTAITLCQTPLASDMTLWSGFRNGHMAFTQLSKVAWDETQLNNSVRTSSFHCDCCTAMATVTLDGCPGYGVGEQQPETFVLSASVDGHVMIRDSGGNTAALERILSPVYDISSLGSYYVVGHDMCKLKGCEIMKVVRKASNTQPSVTSVPVVKLSGAFISNIRAVSLGSSQLVAGDERGGLYVWDFPPLSTFDDATAQEYEDQTTRWPQHRAKVDKPKHSLQVSFGVNSVILHGQQVLVITQAEKSGLYIIDSTDWRKLYKIKHEKLVAVAQRYLSHVQCLAAWGSLLALGCRSGEVLLFNISSKDWPKNLSQSLISVFHSKVTDLVTLGFSDDGRGMVLIVAGSETVVFRWRKGEKDLVDSLVNERTGDDETEGAKSGHCCV